MRTQRRQKALEAVDASMQWLLPSLCPADCCSPPGSTWLGLTPIWAANQPDLRPRFNMLPAHLAHASMSMRWTARRKVCCEARDACQT